MNLNVTALCAKLATHPDAPTHLRVWAASGDMPTPGIAREVHAFVQGRAPFGPDDVTAAQVIVGIFTRDAN